MATSDSDVNTTIHESTNTLRHISETLFNGHSFLVLVLSLIGGYFVGKVLSLVLRRLSRTVGRRADASTDLGSVNRYRRIETWLILSIAVVRVFFLIVALYFWWVYTHGGQSSTGLVGASAIIIIVLGGVFGPLLRDFAFGSGMMAEHWFGVGDLVTIDPFQIQGVVERLTLRSTRIRGLNGEVIWVSNQNIGVVRIAQKGVWTMAIELFVTSRSGAEALIDKVNNLLPTGPSLVASEIKIMTMDEHDKGLWHITALAEVAPGRNWLIENTALELFTNLDEKSSKPILLANPVARFADNDTEREFARAVTNAKKTHRPRAPFVRHGALKINNKK